MALEAQLQEWLALGHRYDDVNLWEKLCQWLDAQLGKRAYESQFPQHLCYLVVKSTENTYCTWLFDHFLMPIFYKSGTGWRLKRDWQDRIAVMRSPTPQKLLTWMAETQDTWYKTYMLNPRSDDRFYCLMCQQEYVSPFPLLFFRDDDLKRVRHLNNCGMTKIQARITQLKSDHPGLIMPVFLQSRMRRAVERVTCAGMMQ
jgi:hypothetical protein